MNNSGNKLNKPLIGMLAAVLTVVTACLCVLIAVLVNVSRTNGFGGLPQYNIEYDFDDDHLVGLCQALSPNVVEIRYEGNSLGTGVILTVEDSLPVVLTNYHIAGLDEAFDAQKTEIRFMGKSVYKADITEVLGYDAHDDIAVLKLLEMPPLGCRDLVAENKISYEMKMGQRVLGLGNALGKGISAFEGIVANPARVISLDGKTLAVSQITAPVNPGSSGGPLFDMAGRLIGINAYQTISHGTEKRPVDNVSYTIPMTVAKCIYDLSGNGGAVKKAEITLSLGASDEPSFFHSDLNVSLKLTDGNLTVTGKTAISDSELMAGDQLISVGETDITANCALILSAFYPYQKTGTGAFLKYRIKRGGAIIERSEKNLRRVI